MKIFLSWSGERSKHIAENLSNWLEQVLQVAEPWISTDIEKGKRWSNEISERLKDSKVAIICLTNDNLDSKWIHFEAGAIAKTADAYICTFLYDVNPTNVQQPLSQFQNTKFLKSDVLKLIKTINTKIGNTGGKSLKEANLESVFNTFWPQLEEKLENVPDSVNEQIIRTDREILEESIQILRTLKNRPTSIGSFLQEQNDEIAYSLRRYAEIKNIPLSIPRMKPHIDQITDFMWETSEAQAYFNNKRELLLKISDKIEELVPF